jgi:hypothetical protein
VVGVVAGVALSRERCPTDQEDVAKIQRLIAEDKTEAAQALAELSLVNACGPARAALADLAHRAGVLNLLKHPELGEQAADRWIGIEEKALAHGVGKEKLWGPMTIFAMAWNAGMYPLARSAFLRAWKDGLVSPTDRDGVRRYYGTLYNEGERLVEQGQGALGWKRIATAAAIADAYDMPAQGEAAHALERRFGDRSQWPAPDRIDPVLNKIRS